MKITLLIGAIIVAISLPTVTVPAQIAGSGGPIAFTNLATTQYHWLFLPNKRGGTNIFLLARPNATNHAALLPAAPGKSPVSFPLPGVYKTEPYACIVIVPGTNSDDRIVARPVEQDAAIVAIKPELRFIPLNSK